jgi:hypothetical protein
MSSLIVVDSDLNNTNLLFHLCVEDEVTVSLQLSLLSPNLIPMDFDFGEHLTRYWKH